MNICHGRTRLYALVAWGWLIGGALLSAQDTQAPVKLGDYRDGNKSIPVHHIGLYDEDGFRIRPGVNFDEPFSLSSTCGRCHDVDTVSQGWHFAPQAEPNAPGPVGEPWVYWDCASGTQIPVSQRLWEGTYRPEDIGLTDWWFIRTFGRHIPGGGSGIQDVSAPPHPEDEWAVSGNLEVNCLSCHDAEPQHDQTQMAQQIKAHNFRWAAAATAAFAHVEGEAKSQDQTGQQPTVMYDESRFFADNRIMLDLRRDVPNQRCAFCHSTALVSDETESHTVDVHIAAGMSCVDCHTNGLDHQIARGYETEARDRNRPEYAAFSCRGCHLGQDNEQRPTAGRLAAPYPEHRGIPAVHFEVLSCTACHSGPWPDSTTAGAKTSRAHALGTYSVNRSDDTLPHIQTPVFAPGYDGKIAPHKLIWPSYWAWVSGDQVRPIPVDRVKELAGHLLPLANELDSASWPDWTQDDIEAILMTLDAEAASGTQAPQAQAPQAQAPKAQAPKAQAPKAQAPKAQAPKAQAAYISGGKRYVVKDGQLQSNADEAARPYLWPLAHDVRPAEQSLGVRSCQDCHDVDSGFHFGRVAVDGPLADPNETIAMVGIQQLDPMYTRAFARSFQFRSLFKGVNLLACILITGVLMVFGLRALNAVIKTLGRKDRCN